MKKKRNMKFSLKPIDAVIALVCAAGIGLSLAFFVKDMNVSLATDEQKPIGVIYFKKNTVQRRLINHNLWERLRVATPVYDGDRIRTGDFSEASLVFNDDTVITLYDNTMVQIFGGDGSSLDFNNGSIAVASSDSDKASGETIKIKTGNKVLSLSQHASVMISAPEVSENQKSEKQAVVAVSSGEVYVKPVEVQKKVSNNQSVYETIPAGSVAQYEISYVPETKQKSETRSDSPSVQTFTQNSSEPALNSGKIETAQSGQTVLTEKTESAEKTKNEKIEDFRVLMPSANYSVTQNQDEIKYIPFFWTDLNNIRIEFSDSPKFTQIIDTEYLSSPTHKASVSIGFAENGEVLYWRALPAGEKYDPSKSYSTGKITVHSEEQKQAELKQVLTQVYGAEQSEKMTEQLAEDTRTVTKNEAVAMSDIKPAAKTEAKKAAPKTESKPVPTISTYIKEKQKSSPETQQISSSKTDTEASAAKTDSNKDEKSETKPQASEVKPEVAKAASEPTKTSKTKTTPAKTPAAKTSKTKTASVPKTTAAPKTASTKTETVPAATKTAPETVNSSETVKPVSTSASETAVKPEVSEKSSEAENQSIKTVQASPVSDSSKPAVSEPSDSSAEKSAETKPEVTVITPSETSAEIPETAAAENNTPSETTPVPVPPPSTLVPGGSKPGAIEIVSQAVNTPEGDENAETEKTTVSESAEQKNIPDAVSDSAEHIEISKIPEAEKTPDVISNETDSAETSTVLPSAAETSSESAPESKVSEAVKTETGTVNNTTELSGRTPAVTNKTESAEGESVNKGPSVSPVEQFKTVKPVLKVPSANKIFTDDDFATMDEPGITFEWNPVENAQEYTFEIRNENGEVIWTGKSRNSKYLLFEHIDVVSEEGTYTWSVTALTKYNGTVYNSQTSSRQFQIQLKAPDNVKQVSGTNLITIEN